MSGWLACTAVKFGILPPYRAGVTADPEWMSAFARHAEYLGFESIYTVEHVVVPVGYAERYPYSDSGRMALPDDCPIPDPLDLLAFLAGRTERLVLATGILVAPHHHPLILAKRLATVDRLSGGRMRLGVGVGWMREELESTGIGFEDRGMRLDEILGILKLLWSTDEASHRGHFFAFETVHSQPRPVRLEGIPIHVGGHSKAAARRAGLYADGYHPLGLDDETLSQRVALVRQTAEENGRDPDSIELTLGANMTAFDDAALEAAEAKGADRVVVSSVAGEMAEMREEMDVFAQRFGLTA
ncbi:MAG: F420-dependent glucose-6-phosphate dehydrogenase [Acidimicrobiales bacterium]|nr:F420-dependent glucose-6-phosphate dehydrogenase [Acidimicrobiales bacterium]